MQASYESAGHSENAPPPLRDTSKNVEMEESIGLLARSHRAKASNANVRTYKLRDRPENVRPGLRNELSEMGKQTNMGLPTEPLGSVSTSNVIQIFGRTSIPTECCRLGTGMSKLDDNEGGCRELGEPVLRRNISATRYDAAPSEISETSTAHHGSPQEPDDLRAIINSESPRRPLLIFPDRDAMVVESIPNTATCITGDESAMG